MQNLIAYLSLEKNYPLFVRCKNKKCQKNVYKGYIDVSSQFEINKFSPKEIILPCCQSKVMVNSIRFIPSNRKTPEKKQKIR